ncbi:phenylalanine--tRNA ligase subunit beta [Saccharomonospora xinjiangensis]|uniref:phenylalanine--tRNA ligase subunit beta n=1 Tax=Saccharomonospora xinjiangensis TaxID=75294 RepID=UPI00106F3DDA|nr:phenylalanine--tRNA ligase subunit beta [Saccharomonospora xinjiangensis]QBQ61204.1 Phenylalanine--tRNA ligase beta subunit [Saccharomonospora xinjiangensis]
MKVPASWLREHLELGEDVTNDDIANAFVNLGIEVEGVEAVGEITGPLVIGRVVEIEELTDFKKPIRYCRVDVGGTDEGESGEDIDPTKPPTNGIICGATNFAEGDLVVVALPGAVLPGGFAISARKTYGHVSEGMICSVRELGIGEDHGGILVLPSGTADPGDDAREVLGLVDAVFELTPTPDLGHTLSVRGLARELACAFDVPYGDPANVDVPEGEGDAWPVRIEDPQGCRRFVLRRVTNLDAGAPTPWWIQRRLLLAGMRPISLAVDVTNYVMLELGHPLHAFDTNSVRGDLVIRRAKPGETLTTLDDVERTLDPDDVVIADDSGVISLAGTMGGAGTEIHGESTDVLLEAAHWDPGSISRTARRHNLFSEAARRFERFTDPELCAVAVEVAARLLRRYGDGSIRPGRTDEGRVEAPPPITMPISLPDRVAGVRFDRGVTVRRLTQIGCKVAVGTGDDGTAVVTAVPPSWRGDLSQAADLVEEVLRLEGYDTIPSVLPAAPAGRGLTAAQRRRRSVSRTLAEAGYVEVLPFPFVPATVWDDLGLSDDDPRRHSVPVLNPLESDKNQLTTTLLPGLLDVLQRNLSRGFRDVALYHIGQVVRPGPEQIGAPDPGVEQRPSDEELAALEQAVPDQPLHVAVVLTGELRRSGWWGKGEPAVWADAVQAARLVGAVSGVDLDVESAELMPWHPGRCARLSVEGRTIGHAGELHPKVVEKLGLPKRTAVMELNLDAIPVVDRRPAPSISPFPPVLLDVALVVDDEVSAADLAAALRDGAGELVEDIALFDLYAGEQIGEGKRSLAYAMRFRAPDRTLTVEEATKARDAAVAVAGERFGAVLRA